MTNAEAAELRGELFGVKVLLFNCLSFIAGQTDDPIAHLDEIQRQAIFGIAQAGHSGIRPNHLEPFRHAAAGIVAQAVEGAKEVHRRAAQPPTRQ
jgi:hypothetical protein